MFYGYDYVSELIVSFVCYCLIARLIKDQQTQRPKGFGFITFESEDDAQKALKALNGKIVNGRLIFVETAKEVEAPTTSLKSNKD